MAPKSLILFIDRCSGGKKLYKLYDKIKYDINGLKISESISQSGNVLYDLTGVVNHSGTLQGGHYTANVRSVCNSKLWFYTSDSHTSPISVNAVIDKDSMILIYEKR
eukprot:124141_1